MTFARTCRRQGVSSGRVYLQAGCIFRQGVSSGRAYLQAGCIFRQGVSSGRALLESILGRGRWDVTKNAGDVPYSLVNPDGSRYFVFDYVAM